MLPSPSLFAWADASGVEILPASAVRKRMRCYEVLCSYTADLAAKVTVTGPAHNMLRHDMA